MNKNLKKVISSVAALAISASAVSAFAVNFPDVADDAVYAQAVQELSALDIISGFDDGTFRPDELVTRAQMSKMIVDALNERAQAEASQANSKFQDVAADHWAKGYINQGVADGFIAGYSDTEFGPEDNVTYVQAQKMLVSAIGYETFAQGNGGWPNGYKQWAATTGITDGISGLVDDNQLTREQVARLIDNAMDAPVCVIKDYTTQWNGAQTPNLEVKDGEGKEYQTLFTKLHDAYKVYGRVTETSRSGNLDTDKVKFRVEKADNYDDKYITASTAVSEEMFYGDTNAVNMESVYSQALVQVNDDDEWTILSIVPTAATASKTVELATDDYDKREGKYLYFFPAGTTRNSQKYELADTVTYYVNGVKMDSAFTLDNAVAYIDGNTTGKVTLMKESNIGTSTTDSKYNTVYITVYATAVVDQVVDKTDTTTVNFKETTADIPKASMKLEKDDDSYSYSFKDVNGDDVDVLALEEDDVLSIAYDVKGAFENSNFYEVIVSKDKSEGRYTGTSGDDGYKIDGNVYKFAYGMQPNQNPFATSTDYTLYLDAFGKIAYYDEVSSSKKIGILKSVYRKNNGDYEAEIIDKDANVITYTMDYKANENDGAEAVAKNYGGTAADDSTYASGLSKHNADFNAQVVEYKTTTAGKLTVKTFMNATPASTTGWGTYKENSNRIGSVRLSQATTIIDLSGKDDTYKVITEDSFDNDSDYEAYGYDYNSSDSSYRYVLVLDNNNKWNSKTQMAIYIEKGTDTNEDGDEVDVITLAYNGEEDFVTLTVDEDYTLPALEAGDAIIFSTTTAGEVDGIEQVIDKTKAADLFGGDYNNFRAIAINNMATANAIINSALPDLTDKDESNVKLQFGILVKDGNSVSLVTDFTDLTNVDLDNAQNLTTSNAKIYTYDFSNSTKNNGRFVLDNGIIKTPDINNAYVDKNNNIYNFTQASVYDDIVFAVVRTFDNDEVQEIYQIIRE